jgi:hypothetical protein
MTEIPWMILTVQMKSPAQGSDHEQAPPDVDEFALVLPPSAASSGLHLPTQ